MPGAGMSAAAATRERNRVASARFGEVWAGGSPARWIAASIVVAALVGALDVLVGDPSGLGSSRWPAGVGVAVSALLLLGPRAIPAVLAGHALAILVAGLAPAHAAAAFGLAAFRTLLAAGSGEIAWRRLGFDVRLERLRDVGILLFVAIATCVPVGAASKLVAVTLGLQAFDWLDGGSALRWLADVVAIFTIAPFVLDVLVPKLQRTFAPAGSPWERIETRPLLPFWRPVEAVAWSAVLLGVGAWAIAPDRPQREYLCLLPMIVLAVRGGLGAAATAALFFAVAVLGVPLIDSGHLPLADLQVFVGALALTGTFLGTLVNERESNLHALRLSQARLEQANAIARLGHFEVDLATGAVTFSSETQRLFGLPDGPSRSADALFDEVHEDDRAALRRAVARALASESPESMDFRVRVPSGEERHVAATLRLSGDPAARTRRLLGVVLDVTERAAASAALREREERFRQLVENLDPGFGLVSFEEGRVLYVSPSVASIWGVPPEALGNDLGRILSGIHPEDRRRLLERTAALQRGELRRFELEYRILRPGGAVVWVRHQMSAIQDASGRVRGASGIVTNVTERRQLEEQLMQAQKMEGIGRLAGGVAHDFNNLLTVVLGHLELLAGQIAERDPAREDVEQALRAGQRAAELVRQLLAFARRQHIEPRVVDLRRLVLGLEQLLRTLVGEAIAVSLALPEQPAPVYADPAQLEQILVNLAVNARDAMAGGGRLEVRLRDESGPDPSRLDPRVVLEVSDEGVGMTAEVLAHAFEPFFTTKEPGQGTGLGLSVCYGIVKQAGGQIRAESRPGAGTRIEVVLPRARGTVAPDPEHEGSAVVREARGSETVLVAEDEEPVRALVVRTLRRHGYRVIEASNGADALARAREHDGPIHLLLTDVVMPSLGGVALAESLRSERKRLPVLYVSGESGDALGRLGGEDESFLAKPFGPATLVQRVRDALDRAERLSRR